MKKTAFITLTKFMALAIVLSLVTGCAPKARKAGGYMDTPLSHCKEGMKYYNDGKYDKAKEEFNLATSLDAKYAPAYAGLALVTAQKGDFKEAIKLAEKCQSLDNKIVDGFIAKAIVITMQNEDKPAKEWLKDVENEYEKALKVDPQNSEVYYRRGVCYKKAYEFGKAADDFKKVLELKKDWTKEADDQWKLVQDIERAAPGTDVGKRIALVDKISRADIAALFVSELQIDKLIEKKRPKNYDNSYKAPTDAREMKVDSTVKMADITDIGGHWAKNFITDIVDLKIRGLEPYPDHTFHPDQLVNRGEYAMVVEEAIIAILRDPSLSTKHLGTESRFPDVNPSHPAYNAICNAVDKGVMSAEMNGEFGMQKSVSGPDALLVIRKLKELAK
ncbi:MAG TPA: S-layer homology domain-containing protein [Chitinivibrionales bacterium]|nr:S-layer homology domain-containing protein [Chitinivibrionales bacterium]